MTPAEQAVLDTIKALYVAAAADDEAVLTQIFSPDFYAFDGGRRFVGMQLAVLVKSFHDQGKRFVWNVTEPRVQVEGSLAWITFVNRGAVGDAAGMTPAAWLESAVLALEADRWRLRFLHSSRMEE